MKLGILYDQLRKDEKLLLKEAKKRGIKAELIDANKLIIALEKNELNYDLVLERCINHARAFYSLKVLNEYGIKTINNSKTAEICGSKFLVTETLLKEKIPTPKVMVAFTKDAALDAIERLGYPCVLKPALGSWGTLLSKINDREAAEAILSHKKILGSYHHSIYYIQEYIRKPGRDIRAFVIGDEVVDAIYRTSRHWITHLDKGAIVEKCPITDEIKNIAVKTAKAVNGDFVAIDLVESDSGLQVIEVDYTVEFSKFFPTVDKNIVKKLFDHIEEQK